MCERKKTHLTGETRIKKEKEKEEADTSELGIQQMFAHEGRAEQPPPPSAQSRHSVTICRILKKKDTASASGKAGKEGSETVLEECIRKATDKPGAPVTPTPSRDLGAHATHCSVLALPGTPPLLSPRPQPEGRGRRRAGS